MAALPDRGVPLSTLSPKFLHTNSTSHTWPFSAIAELIDNAYDPDVSAKQFWIDKTVIKGELCLTFMDNGNGLNHETIHKMLSFGYSDKVAVNGLEPIGIYGNGFKSGSMRLGKDAIVFSRSSSSSCVGMLSQTYLEMINANQIIVPIVCFEKNNSDKFFVRKEHEASLRDILRYSLFSTKEELLAEINAIQIPGSQQETGTRIIIWNLRRTSTGAPEFDFDKDRYDIQIPSEIYETMQDPSQHPNRPNSYIPQSVYSLRAYCSILYLKPRMQVMVRGHKVKSELIAKSLAFIRKDHYKPIFVKKRIPITFGYNTKSKDQYGIMMYHKNRLIKAYERVGCQLKANNMGVGVIGVIECNFLDPTHNKQSFIESDKYRKTMINLGIKLEEYWNEIRYRRTKENPNDTVPVEDAMKRPDQNWVQCDHCLHWRKLPDGIDCSKLPDKWFCRMNPDPQFRSCQVEEEPEDSDDDQPSYRKTYKQHEREDRRKQEQKMQLELKRHEERRLNSLKKQGEVLGRQHENLVQQLNQTAPSTPSTPRSRLQGGAVRAESSSTPTSSQAGPSTSSHNTGLPVITSVCSLSVEAQRGKRPQPVSPQVTPKRPRKNGFHQSASAGDLSWRSSSVCVDDDDDDDAGVGDDDEIVILETTSTPKPQKPAPSVTKVKKEEEASELAVSMLLECTDDAAVDFSSEDTAAGPSTRVVNSTTQTAAPEVKLEPESQRRPGEREKGCSDNGAEPRTDTDSPGREQQTFKQENEESSQSGNRGEQALSNGVTHMESDEIAEPSYLPVFPGISEAQKQQDQLLELMQGYAQERDSLKEEVQRLNAQLQDRLQERVSVKRECSHQACQTEAQKDYKRLFEKAKKKVHDLVKDKEFLSNAADIKTGANVASDDEPDVQEISLQVGGLVRELDQRNKETDELRSKLVRLEEEKSTLAARCEELRLGLERETAESRRTTSVPSQSDEAGGSEGSGSNSEDHRSLIKLRKNVGRLLNSYIPDLDLDQVNYDCTVIDEILEQYVNDGWNSDAVFPPFSLS